MLPFTSTHVPPLRFAPGAVAHLAEELQSSGYRTVAVVIGSSLLRDALWSRLVSTFESAGISARAFLWNNGEEIGEVDGAPGQVAPSVSEPDPDIVDRIAGRIDGCDAVVGIGGGSAIDTAKAVAAAAVMEGNIADYLEGVGTRLPSGSRLPFIAVPTTAGTGSEATKNAVLSRRGNRPFKKSLRHDRYVPDLVIIDPEIHLSCPQRVTAASGLDAITQLLESYVSTAANPITDALALSGLEHAGRSFLRAVERGDSDLDARAGMALAAFLSGVCLANAGLGTVHGLAGPAGAHAEIPHGVFCALLLAPVTEATIEAVRRERDGLGTLGRYAAASRALTGRTVGALEAQIELLVSRIGEFRRISALGTLSDYGFDDSIAPVVAAESGNKNNPYHFSESERLALLRKAL